MDKLAKTRKKIDKIDKIISKNLRKRLKEVRKIGEIKKNYNSPVEDQEREAHVMSSLETEFEKNIFKTILEESRKAQREL
ncbi:MAG: chorismate mutase [Candidatus Peregrinibacteria bacterium]